ncbi:MAG: DNA methyltransferase [Anaerolineaceae bacterium]|nr:DNA methyltransferase [Anaerolineaceae bacterium]MDE0328074.1 DNA methyltransferase [Anaerolineaceae bacterium]
MKFGQKQQNLILPADRPIHDWYRFVLSFPPHLVRKYICEFGLRPGDMLLDPFCGTGTTIVEAKFHGLQSIGVEANPFPHFASAVKTNWCVNPTSLLQMAYDVSLAARDVLSSQGIVDQALFSPDNLHFRVLPEDTGRLLIKDSICPLPLHKTLVLLDQINKHNLNPEHKYMILALGDALVGEIGNLKFGPEVGVGKKKGDVSVISSWFSRVEKMVEDLRRVNGKIHSESHIYLEDARSLVHLLEPKSVDAVITSPPYPNEKDYTRTTRLESVVLGFYKDRPQLRQFKKTFVRSNTRSIYKADDDDRWVSGNTEVEALANEIEARRIRMGKTSGFERMYTRATMLYFGGMTRHLFQLRHALKPNARVAMVLGIKHPTCKS